ncbi:MAG: hypothetical protein U1D00_02235 [Mycobacterium sp.]|nr:hypothetical protein [Mycobacterium sp.]
MLVKICAEEGIPLVNVVRRPEQVALLRGLGAQYVCDSSQPTFGHDLLAAITTSRATIAFDALGGGTIASSLMSTMETAAVARSPRDNPFGSLDRKHVYVYGHLDSSPMTVGHHDFGLSWGIGGWAMPVVLDRIGTQRVQRLHERIVLGLDDTFRTDYSARISLAESLDEQ